MSAASSDLGESAGARPLVGVSRCLGLAACRWDGAMVTSDAVTALGPYVDLLPLCPEVEMGLGVPRQPIRIVIVDGQRRLVQPATGRDLTEAMEGVVERCLAELAQADGLVLKARSPSCGVWDAREYASPEAEDPDADTSRGMFAVGVLERLPHLAIEDEVGLAEPERRHHFLTRLFTQARFRATRDEGTPAALVRFQTDNKLLLMAYDKRRLGSMGRLAATVDARPMAETLDAYGAHLYAALARPARPPAQANALMHAIGYFRHDPAAPEKESFLDLIERYRRGEASLAECLAVLRSWVARFGQPYLARQAYLQPYPDAIARAG